MKDNNKVVSPSVRGSQCSVMKDKEAPCTTAAYNETTTTSVETSIVKDYYRIAVSRCGKALQRRRMEMASYFKSTPLCFQAVLYLFVIEICLGLMLYFIRSWMYSNILMVDYLAGHKSKYSTGIIQEELTNGLRFVNLDINQQTENHIAQILLMKIYMKEMISKKGLSSDSFHNLGLLADYYNDLNDNQTHYSIDDDNIKKHFGNSNPSTNQNDYLNNLMIVNYLFAPLLKQEARINKNNLASTFLLAYYVDAIDTSNKRFEGSRFFAYPVNCLEFHPNDYFHQINKLSDPDILSNFNPDTDHEYNPKGFIKANWFYSKDYSFRQQVSTTQTKSVLSFYNSAAIEEIEAKRYHYEVLQFTVPDPRNDINKPLVINLIFKYKEEYQNDRVITTFSFLIQDLAFNKKEGQLKKYSDGESYVITENAIAPFAISDNLLNYFTYQMYHKDSQFYVNGDNFDTFDLEYFDDIEAIYFIQSGMAEDVMLFKVMNFYYQITIERQLDKTIPDPGFFFYLANYTKKDTIKTLCDSVDIAKYYKDLQRINKDLDCLSDYEMYYYLISHGMDYNTKAIDMLPNCLCLPFYCLDLKRTNLDKGEYEYTKMLQLPNNCLSNHNFYYAQQDKLKDFRLGIRGEDFFIRYNRVFFQLVPIPYVKSITMHNVNNVFNYLITETDFLIEQQLGQLQTLFLQSYFGLYIGFGIIVLIMTACKMYHKGVVFGKFMDRQEETIFQLENKVADKPLITLIKEEKEIKPKIDLIWNEIVESSEKRALITANNKAETAVDNSLVDDLFKFFCAFRKLNKSSVMKQIKRRRRKGASLDSLKCDYMINSDELFFILGWITQVAPSYQMDLKLDINLYKTTSLVNNYAKKSSTKEGVDISQAILCELLSTESLFDQGIMYNTRFNYRIINKVIKLKETSNEKNFKLLEKREDSFFERCELEFKGNELNKINEIKSSFNFYLIKVYYDLMNNIHVTYYNNLFQVCALKRSHKLGQDYP